MIFVEHRINTLDQLALVSIENGVEIDLRSDCSTGKIHMHHDPFVKGLGFEEWLDVFIKRKISGPIILNTKEDALESRIIEICESKGVTNFFFLDTALPTLVRWALKKGESRFACRISIHEPAEALQSFRGKVDWLWVDCFDGIPLKLAHLESVKNDFKICLVAPELQGVQKVDAGFNDLMNIADAICTKKPHFWQSYQQC